MFDFIKENIPEGLQRLFIFNKSVHSYETRSFQMFHIPKWKTLRLGLNTLSYDGTKIWTKSFHAFLHKETDLTKSNLNIFYKYVSLTPMLDHLVCCFCCLANLVTLF